MKRREAVLFDLDGVLAPTERIKADAHIQTVKVLGGTVSEGLTRLYEKVIGVSHEATREAFLKSAGIVATPAMERDYTAIYRRIYAGLLNELKETTPGATALLQQLAIRGYRMGVVSSAHSKEVERILHQTNIHNYFDAIVSGNDVKEKKPAPDPYLQALGLLAITADLAVAFEDTQTGVTAATRANLRVLAVRHSLNVLQDLGSAHQVFNSLSDPSVLPSIERLLNCSSF